MIIVATKGGKIKSLILSLQLDGKWCIKNEVVIKHYDLCW